MKCKAKFLGRKIAKFATQWYIFSYNFVYYFKQIQF